MFLDRKIHPPKRRRLEDCGKVVLITSSSKGIGLACAGAFAAEGARVAICSRDQANLDRALADLTRRSASRRTWSTPRRPQRWCRRWKAGWGRWMSC